MSTVTTDNGPVHIKKSVNESGTKLTLEAYLTNEVTETVSSKPLDIVLVLDQSGSMAYDFSGNNTSNNNARRQFAMKKAVTDFISKVGVQYSEQCNHRMAIVIFGNNASTLADWTYVNTSGNTALTSMINNLPHKPEGATNVGAGMQRAQSLMNSAQTGTDRQKVVIVFTDGVPTITSDFDTSVANTAIRASKAMKDEGTAVYTVGIFNGANPNEMYGASGFDTNSNGTVGSKWSKETWGLFPSTDFPEADRPAGNRFLNLVSSNYPSADSIGLKRDTIGAGIAHSGVSYTITKNFDRLAEGNYYLAATDSDSLTAIFQKIVSEISTLKIKAGTNAVLSDTLSQYFALNVPEGTAAANAITAEQFDCTGKDANGNYTWEKANTQPEMTVNVNGKKIEVTGFDYTENAVTATTKEGVTTYSGAKLVVTLPIKPDATYTGWEAGEHPYPTNSTDEGSKAGLSNYTDMDGIAVDPTLLNESPVVKVTAYTVTYTDGVADETVFEDQVSIVLPGTATPVFNGTPTRDGYNFKGWSPAVAPTVTENATYTAQYEKLNNLSYTVHYYLNGTTQKVKDDKVVAGKIFEEVVTETYATIDGYTFAENEANKNKTITIGVENNEIIFYYYQNVTLTANSKTVAYNGETQSISGYTCSVDGVTFEGIEVGAEGKDVGDYPAEFPERTVGKVDTTGKYIVAVANSGMLTIYRVTDAMATIKAIKTLNNDAPGNVQFSFKLESTDGIHTATNDADGRIKFDLTYDKEGIYIYKLSEVVGTDTGIVYDETVYYVKVEVTLVEKEYEAKVSYFKDEACTVSLTTDLPTFNNTTKPTGSLTISKTVSGNAASTTKEFTFIVKLIPNIDTTNNNVIYGNITNVTVIDNEVRFKLKAGESKTIDGLPDGIGYTVQELDSNGYTVSAKVNGDPVQLENNMYADTIAAGVETKIVFNNHKSYVYPPNPPIMDEITVEITGNSDSVVYDGTEHSVKGYTVKISDPRYTEADFTFTGKAEASGVNAGTYEMGLKAEQFKNTNARFTNVKFVIKADGVLTITPKDLTITAGSKTEYGPTPVTCGEWTVSGLAAGDKVESVKITGIQSVPGSSPNVPSDAVIKNAKGEDVTKNYAIKYVNGTLTMLEVLNKEDHFNYIIGTPEGLSLPTANVTRAEVATIFFRLMTDDARAKFDSLDNNFSDVAKGKWYNRAISTLANAGIIKGDPAGTYRPDDPITRAEMAAIIARFGDFKEGGKTFNDISGHWAQKYIELAASNGWINGNPDGTFKPNNNITRAETVAMINRVLDRQTKDVSDLLPVAQMTNWSDNMDTAKWYYRDMQEATNNHKAERVGDSIYEKWTEKLPDIDWASYQI